MSSMEGSDLYTECGAMVFLPISKTQYEELTFLQVAMESVFILPPPPPSPQPAVSSSAAGVDRIAYIYYKYASSPDFTVVIYFSDHIHSEEAQTLIREKELALVGKVRLSVEFPILRIADAREAHFVPKSPTKAQLHYAAKRANCPQEIIDSGHFTSIAQLSEPLYSVPPAYRLEFWTGLNPQPLLDACEGVGLIGWSQLPNGHWTLPSVSSQEEADKRLAMFQEVKQSLSFRCGFDTKASHFLYDICQEKIDASGIDASEYITNNGIAVGIASSNDSYQVIAMPSVAVAAPTVGNNDAEMLPWYVIRCRNHEEEDN